MTSPVSISDLKKERMAINTAIGRVENRIDKLEDKLDQKFDKVMDHLVGLAGKIDDIGLDHKAANNQLDRHEQRITNLERVVLAN